MPPTRNNKSAESRVCGYLTSSCADHTTSAAGPGSSRLNLSMHLPAAASTNRFAALEVDPVEPEQEVKPTEARLPRRYRRVLQSRSLKETRRGRDARRHKQKMAAKAAAAEMEDISSPSSTVMAVAKIKTMPRSPSPPRLPESAKSAPDYTLSAANLWNILHTHPSIPELDGKEIPYVHANSLIGFSNEPALSPHADEHPTVNKVSNQSATSLPTPSLGLDEVLEAGLLDLIKDEPAESVPLPTSTQMSIILNTAEPSSHVIEADDGAPISAASDAYAQAWENFLRTHPCPDTGRSVFDTLDIVAFFKLCHGQDCCCDECGPPATTDKASSPGAVSVENVPDNCFTVTEHDEASVAYADTPELVPFDKLGEVEDEWMLYSASVLPMQSAAVKSANDCNDKAPAELQGDRRPAWDDVFPTKASTVREWNFDRYKDEITNWADTDGYEWDWGDEER